MAPEKAKKSSTSKKKSSNDNRSPKRGKSPKPGKSPRDKSPSRSGTRDRSPTIRRADRDVTLSKHTTSKGSGRKQPKEISTRSERSATSALTSINNPENNVLESIPQEYLFDPNTAEPILHFLPKMMASSGGTTPTAASNAASSGGASANSGASTIKFPNLRVLLAAAEDDIRLHRARKQAGKNNDITLLRTYKIETDAAWLARQQRLNERELMLSKLDTERIMILKELAQDTKGLTAQEKTQVQLARWQRALELYVYTNDVKQQLLSQQSQHSTNQGNNSNSNNTSNNKHSTQQGSKDMMEGLDFLELLEKLLEGIAEEEDMSDILRQAADMCSTLVDVTKQIVKDASEQISDAEDSYQVRLEAHELFCRSALARTEEIQNQFRINGRAALQIGNQLEFAESKRQRCESASILIRRWWLLESLAEQEAMSGDELKVNEEVRGAIPLTSCRMDPLFTRPENSLEAARSLKQLRQVVRSRGNAASANMSTGQWEKTDAGSSRRFDLTANLIQRTSDALEQRLLNNFSQAYSKGGAYDFSSSKPRPGIIAWQELRDLAHALILFDNGRQLHKRYVDIVVGTRFPELFDTSAIKKVGESPEEDDDEQEFDMDATRSKLSSLFHRVSEVCMEEFQLIAYVFDYPDEESHAENVPLTVARALCTRVIGDPQNGLQARINDLLESIDRRSDFDTGAKKLDTFVVIHEKAAGLFGLLRDASERLLRQSDRSSTKSAAAAVNAVESLKAFLTSQEVSLNNSHRHGYLNLELRLLHHECCNALDSAGCILLPPAPVKVDQKLLEKGVLQEYSAPLLPLDKESLKRSGFNDILSGPLKQSVLRQPLIHATDSLARARLMFGSGREGGESAARVITSIYNQMCTFYGRAFLYPIVEALQEMLKTNPPNQAPQLPFDEEQPAHDMGVDPAFWVALERIHSAAKAFDREMWAENRKDSNRVWDILTSSGEGTGISNSIAVARECRVEFFTELEHRGEDAILRALDTLSAHIQWILVTGGEAMLATGGARIFNQLTGQSGGPYAMSSGSSLEAPNSPAVKSLTYCLRVQFVHIQAALTPQSLSAFWTALSMRLYDILVTRLLQTWYVSTVGAVILSRDVEALRSVSMLAGTHHEHWDILRELLTLYMTPPDALKTMLVGPEGDATSGKGLFQNAGRDQSLVFMSRRVDYRYKTAQGQRKSVWVTQLLDELGVRDPTDSQVNIGKFAAGRRMM